jgi:thiamine biosynthesis lipoprotein
MRGAHEWSLWSTRARVCVTDVRVLDEAVARTRVLLAEVDDAANRFRAESEINQLRGTLRLSPMLADLVRTTLGAAQDTDGALDPTVGAALAAEGYDRSFPLAPTTTDVVAGTPAPGWRTVRLVDDVLTVPDGVRLDLGALAKAIAADRAAALVHEALGAGVLVALGGDIATAGQGPIGGWQIRVRDHAADPDAHVSLADGWAVATSSTAQRTWTRNGTTRHHLIDPATGRSAVTPWRTVSVAAPTCAGANTATTAAIVKGAAGRAWLVERGLAARLVDHDGLVHLLGGWPPETHEQPSEVAA